MASPFHLSRRRSNSSPQLRCESTVDISNEPSTSKCAISEGTCNSPIYTDHEKNWRLDTNGVTRASVHWLEPKQRAVHHEPVEMKPVSASCHTNIDPINDGIERLSIPDPDMLCCNETIHYLQGSDSDSSLPGTPQMRVRRYRSDGHSRLNKISKAACRILSKFRLREFHRRRSGSYRQNMLKRMEEDDTELEQQTINRRTRLSSVRMLKHCVKDNAASTSAVNEQREVGSVQQNCHSLQKEPMPKECIETKKVKKIRRRRSLQQIPLVNFDKFDPEKYPIECTEEIERAAREREIEEGIDSSVTLQNESFSQKLSEPSVHVSQISQQNVNTVIEPTTPEATLTTNPSAEISLNAMSHTTENIYDLYGSLTPSGTYIPRTVHTQIDYMHCLVPNQWDIMKSSYYWGKIDRYEADNLLENKPEGTFILRNSAQEEFLFSVSFCRYGRTLHARIEQWNHKFSFDAHDPGVYSSNTVCGLLEHYKDPNYCMFFEPMLTNPLPRVDPPSLQELGRASICTLVTYDGICYLKLPNGLKEFLREYHYKQRVRIRRVEVNMPQLPQVEQGVVTNTCISR